MDQKIVATAVAALTFVAVYGIASAASTSLLHAAAADIAPATAIEVADQREIIAPPPDIDPGMTKMPPATGARMPVIAPPEVPGGRFGIQR
jgi:hypothetical protein